MTLESLTNRLLEYVSWLYYERQWASWELGVVAVTALVLLLLTLRRMRKAKAMGVESAGAGIVESRGLIGAKLAAGRTNHLQAEQHTSQRLTSLSDRDGKKRRWKQTARELKGFGALVEQLQIEVSRYKVAEESFKQQLVKLKAANERLRQELTERGIRHSDLGGARPLARLSKQQDRVLDGR
jgi:hypothetical protein